MNPDGAEFVLVCSPSTDSSVSPQVLCGNVEGVPYYAQAIKAHLLTTEQYQDLVKTAAPFDATKGAELFAWGFGVVVTCWLVAHMAGVVLKAVRDFAH